jgi:hypothetical protein
MWWCVEGHSVIVTVIVKVIVTITVKVIVTVTVKVIVRSAEDMDI